MAYFYDGCGAEFVFITHAGFFGLVLLTLGLMLSISGLRLRVIAGITLVCLATLPLFYSAAASVACFYSGYADADFTFIVSSGLSGLMLLILGWMLLLGRRN
jgi:hypothetical protein